MFSGSPEAGSTSEILSLPSLTDRDGARAGSGGRIRAKKELLAERSTKKPGGRSKSTEPISSAAGGEGMDAAAGFSSFALYCEVKLKESRTGHVGASAEEQMPDLNVVNTCFTLLDQICSSDTTMAGPLRSVTAELRNAIFSTQVDLTTGQERKPYFSLVTELEAEADRIRRNTAQIVSQAAIHAGHDPNGGGGGGELSGAQQRKKDMMTQSRLMHLETEMHHMFSSVQRADESLIKQKQAFKERDALVKDLKEQIAVLKFELESSVASETRAEALADSVSSKLAGIEFERVQLGFGAKDARSQLDILQARNERLETVGAELNARLSKGEQVCFNA